MTPDLDELARRVRLPETDLAKLARERLAGLAKPVGALGRLEELAEWLTAAQGTWPPHLDNVRVVVFAGDHGIAKAGVSAYPAEITALMVRTFVSGGAAVNVLARQVGASVRVADLAVDADLGDVPPEVIRHKVRRASGRIDVENALTLDEAEAAFTAGMTIADEEVDAGADLVIPGDMGIGNTTPSAVLTTVLTNKDVASVVGRGTGIDDDTWMRKAAAVRDAARRARPLTGDLIALLAAVAGADIAAMTGFIAQAAARRTPVLLDGVVSAAAALVAQRITYRVGRWCLAGHRSPEPAHDAALGRLGLTPIVDFGMRLGEGTGALLAVPVLQAATAISNEMATLAEVTGDLETGQV
jgi:nicotinate-nucleotide--dimethylbenzimidazole phosphoribosyltransferase